MSIDVGEVLHVGGDEVDLVRRRGADRLREGDAPDRAPGGAEQGVGAVLDRGGDVGVGRAAVGRVVLEPAVGRRVVRRGDDDAVGAAGPCAPRLWARIACEMTGVGVTPSSRWIDDLHAVGRPGPRGRSAGPGRTAACVSLPRNSGPVDPLVARGSRRWPGVIARMCASVNVPSSGVPRWPLVPKATRCLGSRGSGGGR